MEPYDACTRCDPRPPEHDRTDYGDGRALRSAFVILMSEAGAADDQIEAVWRALGGGR